MIVAAARAGSYGERHCLRYFKGRVYELGWLANGARAPLRCSCSWVRTIAYTPTLHHYRGTGRNPLRLRVKPSTFASVEHTLKLARETWPTQHIP
jgi:hypothetical protein